MYKKAYAIENILDYMYKDSFIYRYKLNIVAYPIKVGTVAITNMK